MSQADHLLLRHRDSLVMAFGLARRVLINRVSGLKSCGCRKPSGAKPGAAAAYT